MAREQLELVEIPEARVEVLVLALEVRAIPFACQMHLSGPRALRVGERQRGARPACANPGPSLRRREALQGADGAAVALRSDRGRGARCRVPCRAGAAESRKAARVLRGLSAQRSTASRSLMCAASRNLRPPYFTKGI